ncbi:uncharacterized protein LOC128388951 [Panonychus citri]|uniref:uncharacterized protein LOC128388951 n=1 Tax=Panonychus citri TaxID=50023 RepID=UPI0023082557|nr:uncharacterized protein LOC128388951 [Panonychus citri]
MFQSSRLLVSLLRSSSKLYYQNQQILVKCLTGSLVDSTSNVFNQQSTLIVTDEGKDSNCKPIDGQSIYGQKLIVKGDNVPEPWDSLDCFEWPVVIREYLTRKGITKPTTIQSQSWPIALSGRDLVGISTTGSGKTLAFALPALCHIESMVDRNKKRYHGPSVVILTPTRELAQQINQVFIEIGHHIPVCLFGGAARRAQSQSLTSRNPDILIATPDRMLELGLEAQIRRIIERTPKQPNKRQTLLFSATWPDEVRDLSLDFLRDFIQINVGSAKLVANPSIDQNFIFLEPVPKAKESAILSLLDSLDDGTKKLPNHKILIFVATKKGADFLQRYLTANGFYSMAIHSDRPQHSRNLMIEAFRSGDRSILIGTDIASRGLDIDNISVVINYDMPITIEDYVHRIGRTARVSKSGKSYSFFMPEDSRLSVNLVDLLKNSNQKIDPKLIVYSKLVSKQQQTRDKMGYQRYGAPMKKRIQDKQNLMSNYRKVIYK